MDRRIAPGFWSRPEIAEHLIGLGLAAGDSVMVHAGMRSVGPLLDGPDTLIRAILDVIGPRGTLLAYTDWEANYQRFLDEDGHLPERLRHVVAPFYPAASRAARDHGVLAEFVRTSPGAVRSRNPGASVAAVGSLAQWFVADHPIDYGYGEGSPFAKLVEAGGKVMMIGAPLDTMTLLHHAEHKAKIRGKRIIHGDVPLLVDRKVEWRAVEEYSTSEPIVAGLDDDYFTTIVEMFLASGRGNRGQIGDAPSVVVPAREIVDFAVTWLEGQFPPKAGE